MFLPINGFVIFFNEDSDILPINFYSQPRIAYKLGKKGPVKQNNFPFHEINVFSLHVSLYIFLQYIYSWIQNEKNTIKQKPRTT